MLEPLQPTGIEDGDRVADDLPRRTDEVRWLRAQLAERTRQLEESEARAARAVECAQRQSEILAVHAHDLRSPLAAIIGYADLLDMGVPESIPDCALECVGRIREAAQQLQTLLDHVLAHPRSELRG
jgi:signal transduction histidine kinase